MEQIEFSTKGMVWCQTGFRIWPDIDGSGFNLSGQTGSGFNITGKTDPNSVPTSQDKPDLDAYP